MNREKILRYLEGIEWYEKTRMEKTVISRNIQIEYGIDHYNLRKIMDALW